MPTKPISHAHRLENKICQVLDSTQADKDEITQILISFLAVQLASYPPFLRDSFFDAAMDTLEETFEEICDEMDKEVQLN